MKANVAVGLIGLLSASAALSETRTVSCSPKDATARILKSANPSDTAPGWGKDSSIGLSWSFFPKLTVKTDTGTYLQGDLVSPRVSPRGGTTYHDVFIRQNEWDCAQ